MRRDYYHIYGFCVRLQKHSWKKDNDRGEGIYFAHTPQVWAPNLCALLSSFCGLLYRIVHMCPFKVHLSSYSL